jgi:hypothetical protein
MLGLLHFVLAILVLPFKSKTRLEAETAVLRHQLIVLRRKLGGRIRLSNSDRWFLVQMYCWFPSILQVLTIIRPETLVRWHRVGFRHYWRWKSRSLGGRPQIEAKLRMLIRSMSIENPLWGAPRIHSELLKLGIEVAQSSVAKYMVKRPRPSSQGWRAFLHNHAPDVAARDMFVVPTIGFRLLYAFVIVGSLTPELLKDALGLRIGQMKRFLVENRTPQGVDDLVVLLSKVSSQDIATFPQKLKELDGVRDVTIMKKVSG